MRLPLSIGLTLVCVVALSGCKDQSEAQSILPKADKFFPGSGIFKFDKRILWVQTQVNGISADVANTMFKAACQQATYNLGRIKINIQTELAVDDKQLLIVGFEHFWVVWPVRNGVDAQGVPVGYQVMNAEMFKNFLTSRLGYFPPSDKILVVREQDLENTPQGQPMQLKTLADLQAEKKARLLQELGQQPN